MLELHGMPLHCLCVLKPVRCDLLRPPAVCGKAASPRHVAHDAGRQPLAQPRQLIIAPCTACPPDSLSLPTLVLQVLPRLW